MNAIGTSLSSGYFQRALLEAVLVGAVAGGVGVHVVLRRLPFFVVAVSHATFPGLVVASLVGASVFLGGLVAGIAVALAVVLLNDSRTVDHVSATGVVLAGSFALGIVLMTAQPDASAGLAGYLVGSILTVRSVDLLATAAVGVMCVLVLGLLHKELVLSAFDATGTRALGYRPALLDLSVLLVIVAVSVVTIPATGTLLAVALLTIPAASARLVVRRVPAAIVVASVLGAASGAGGLIISAAWSVAPGGAIALASVAAFAACLCVRGVRLRMSAY